MIDGCVSKSGLRQRALGAKQMKSNIAIAPLPITLIVPFRLSEGAVALKSAR